MNMGSKTPLVTVFTPTFNRSYCLHRVLESLKSQTFKNFEWLIIDDGSIDDTKSWVEHNRPTCEFQIRYFYQENNGKHNAINKGASEAFGEFIIIADSDDTFKPETLEVFLDTFYKIPEPEKYAGIWCLVEDESGNIVGDRFPNKDWDCGVTEFYFKNRIQGEKWQMMRTAIMRKHPMPNVKIKGLYVEESIMWMSISKFYLFRCINIPLRIYHSSSDGIMQKSAKIDFVNWYSYYLRFHYLYKDFSQYFRYYPIYFIKGMFFYQFSIYKLKKSFIHEFGAINSFFLKILYSIVFFTIPFILMYKQISLVVRR
ncbi:MAG: glycosyltransferase family 2 protein [Saprospiraceae bacterium]|nr:glycosyltransferase family 2 protein [Saprospiraceae bacterium]MBP9194027.1 glycosyltransferase family 2 protein [Saprospiraceae bacterium]